MPAHPCEGQDTDKEDSFPGTGKLHGPERLSQLIYLDAFVPEQSMLDLQVDRFRQFILERARAGGDGWKLPALDPGRESLELSDPNDVAWVWPSRRLIPCAP